MVRGARGCRNRTRARSGQRGGINRVPRSRHRLNVQGIGINLHEHEVIVVTEGARDIGRGHAVAAAKRSSAATDEVLNAVLQRRPLIDVFVSGEDGVDVMPLLSGPDA